MYSKEDIKRYADMHIELEKMCIAYFNQHSNEWEMYDGFSLGEPGYIIIHYHFLNYMDEWDNNTIELSYEKLIEFTNSQI